jgi:iron(III) transport system permease protein
VAVQVQISQRRLSLGRLKLKYGNPMFIFCGILIIILGYLILVPLGHMLRDSFTWQLADTRLSRQAVPGKLTTFHWARVLKSDISEVMFYAPLRNTLVTGLSGSLLAVFVGVILAWLMARTDLPGKEFFITIAPLPYMMPSWYLALAWLVLFKNDRIGGSVGVFQYLTGVSPPNWISYGQLPIIVTFAVHYYAFAFLMVYGALLSVDSSLEEAAVIQGASLSHILRRITFPIVTPSILSAFILTFSRTLGTFGIPSFLGLPVRYYNLSTMIFSNIRNRQGADAYVIVFFLLIIASLTIYINQLVIGRRKSYATITGKGLSVSIVSLGALKWPIFAVVLAFFLLTVALPVVLLVWQTLMKVDGDYSLSNLTLQYWTGDMIPELGPGVLRSKAVRDALINTLKLAMATATTGAFLGILIGYFVVRLRGTRPAKLLEQVVFLPYLIPSIAFGAIYLTMFAQPIGPIPRLYGTLTLLILISVVKYLPLASRSGISAIMQVGNELEEAATIQGASWLKRVQRILVPLTKSGIVTGFLFIFVSAMKELSLIVLLVTPETSTLNSLTYRYAEQGASQYSSAIILLIMACIFVANLAASRVGKAKLGTGLGG